MNEKIKELYTKALTQVGDDGEEAMVEKFAKLIISEHLTVWERMDNGNSVEGYTDMEDYPKAILQHFGVK